MERPCYRCGALMEEQAPFCSSCRAPQIRVSVPSADPAPAYAPALGSEAATGVPPPLAVSPFGLATVAANQIQWKKFLRIALPFAAVTGFVTLFGPVGWFIFLPGSVMWSIFLYRRRCPGPLPPGRGARLGSAVGLLSSAFYAPCFLLVVVLNSAEFREQLAVAAQKAATMNADPQFQRWVDFFTHTSSGTAIFVLFFLVFTIAVMMACGGAAGALTAVVSGNKRGN